MRMSAQETVLGHRSSRMDLISSMISNPTSERLGLASFSDAALPATESKSSDASHPYIILMRIRIILHLYYKDVQGNEKKKNV